MVIARSRPSQEFVDVIEVIKSLRFVGTEPLRCYEKRVRDHVVMNDLVRQIESAVCEVNKQPFK